MTEEVQAPKIPRYSFSQWENYDGCPQRWKFKSIMKLPSSPPGPAAARGLDMHDRCDKFITNQIGENQLMYGSPSMRFGDKKPAVIAEKYVPILQEFRDHPNGAKHAEYKIGFDEEWYLCGGLSSKAKVIMVLDAVRAIEGVCHIGEWKSGKPKPTHGDQRKLYAMAGIKAWMAETTIVTTYYLEDTAPPERLVVRDTAWPKLVMLWDDRFDRMARDKICAPKPGNHCNWCDYARAKGGPCTF